MNVETNTYLYQKPEALKKPLKIEATPTPIRLNDHEWQITISENGGMEGRALISAYGRTSGTRDKSLDLRINLSKSPGTITHVKYLNENSGHPLGERIIFNGTDKFGRPTRVVIEKSQSERWNAVMGQTLELAKNMKINISMLGDWERPKPLVRVLTPVESRPREPAKRIHHEPVPISARPVERQTQSRPIDIRGPKSMFYYFGEVGDVQRLVLVDVFGKRQLFKISDLTTDKWRKSTLNGAEYWVNQLPNGQTVRLGREMVVRLNDRLQARGLQPLPGLIQEQVRVPEKQEIEAKVGAAYSVGGRKDYEDMYSIPETLNYQFAGDFPNIPELVRKRGRLYVMADGNQSKGREAAIRAVRRMNKHYYYDHGNTTKVAALRDGFEAAHQGVNSIPYDYQRGEKPGATISAAVVVENERGQTEEVFGGGVGDTTIYVFWGDGRIRQVTVNHRWVDELARKGVLTPQEAARHPRRNVITRNLGSFNHSPDMFVLNKRELAGAFAIFEGTDGFWDVISPQEAWTGLRNSRGNYQGVVSELMRLAERRSQGGDNKSVMAIPLT